jgi:hypothetical protein
MKIKSQEDHERTAEQAKGNFAPKPLIEPYVNISIHTVLII